MQAGGGYRAYYAKPGCGTLQGGGNAGGLGLDQEFLESVLVPQVMLHGFLGFEPGADGYTIHPRLPKEWPSLTIAGIRFHDDVLDMTATADGHVEVKKRDRLVGRLDAPGGDSRNRTTGDAGLAGLDPRRQAAPLR